MNLSKNLIVMLFTAQAIMVTQIQKKYAEYKFRESK